MIVRRATVTAPRTLAARIAKLEEARPSDEVSQALARELMELLRGRKRAALIRPATTQMVRASAALSDLIQGIHLDIVGTTDDHALRVR